jgi:hypothetical protein
MLIQLYFKNFKDIKVKGATGPTVEDVERCLPKVTLETFQRKAKYPNLLKKLN